eukprot:688534-Alexandrium_andersonii.AAC.1
MAVCPPEHRVPTGPSPAGPGSHWQGCADHAHAEPEDEANRKLSPSLPRPSKGCQRGAAWAFDLLC